MAIAGVIGWMYSHFAITNYHSDDSAKQWYDWLGVADGNFFWLAEPFTKKRPKTTLAATASTATSNVSSCAHRTMDFRQHYVVTSATYGSYLASTYIAVRHKPNLLPSGKWRSRVSRHLGACSMVFLYFYNLFCLRCINIKPHISKTLKGLSPTNYFRVLWSSFCILSWRWSCHFRRQNVKLIFAAFATLPF